MMTVIGDVLVVNVMQRIGFTAADYAKRHHGGYLGRLHALKTSDNEKDNLYWRVFAKHSARRRRQACRLFCPAAVC